jgi:predicted ATPase
VRLKKLSIQNFRALENINISFGGVADVIVGPNAVGKTTILEAIRLAKAVLAPRTLDEPQNALISLGVMSPHAPLQFNMEALARDPKLPVSIDCTYELADTELAALDSLIPILGNLFVQSNRGLARQGPLALVQFLSTPLGQAEHGQAISHVASLLPKLKASKFCTLNLMIDPHTRNISGSDQISQLVFTALEGRLAPHQALFSYFPADRAMPTGDVNIQLGGPDVQAQLQSHNSQPQTKYHRLKATILSNYLLNAVKPTVVLDEFRKIFAHLLKDREIGGLKVNQFGLPSIQVKDLITNRLFDIDSMSSGEKGLILTFLLLAHSIVDNGVIVIDEPELHLNPAVCKILLPFLIDQYLVPKKIQAIICSHSPEILGVAFDRDDCSLHHLQSPTVVSPILPQDRDEVFEALRRLGTSTSDVLFSSGSIFVEGPDDIDILEAGFSKMLTRYKVTQLGGRRNIEQDIRTLQEAEKRGEIDTLKCFIFDLDNLPTDLTSTPLVRVQQWKRRCIENYLISEPVIYELLRDDGISTNKIEKRGEATAIFKQIAFEQLQDTVVDTVYRRTPFENLGPPPRKELVGKSFSESAEHLFFRISRLQGQLSGLNPETWCDAFEKECQIELATRQAEWETDWVTLCDGKRFFQGLQAKYGIRIKPVKFKMRIMERLAQGKADEWVLVESILRDALKL